MSNITSDSKSPGNILPEIIVREVAEKFGISPDDFIEEIETILYERHKISFCDCKPYINECNY